MIVAAGHWLCAIIEEPHTAQWTDDQAVPSVQIITLKGTKAGGALDLPGDVEAFTNAPIYAQVCGTAEMVFRYRRQGEDRRSSGPDRSTPYQAALDQAQGALARDSATLANAKVDLARYQALAAQNAISSQQLATQQATVNSDAGVVEADRAAVSKPPDQSGLYPYHRAL